MDIYQRRRLTAVGVFVTFISVIAIAAGSGGGGDSSTPITTDSVTSGASGAAGAQALAKPDFIAQADSVCAQANSSIAGATGVGTAVPDPGVKIRQKEYNQLTSLTAPTKGAAGLKQFLGGYKALLAAVKKRELANKRADTTAQAAAGDDIGTATTTIEDSGTAYGFKACNSLDATTSSSGGANSGTTNSGTTDTGGAPTSGAVDPGTTTPTDTGTVTPTTPPGTVIPPATDPGTVTPPADTGGSDSSGGVVVP